MAAIVRNPARFDSNDIAIFGDYRPWSIHRNNGGDSSNYPEYSGRILDLKEGKSVGISYFVERIKPELRDDIAIVVVPSHDPAKPSSGMMALAAALAKGTKRMDASSCLIRSKKIGKLAHGGDRSEAIHLQSVTVTNVALIKGRDVFLLDDVMKTGNSLIACRKLLLVAGARSVQCAAIGKT